MSGRQVAVVAGRPGVQRDDRQRVRHWTDAPHGRRSVGQAQRMATTRHANRHALSSGLVGLVIGVLITVVIAVFVPTPWSLGQVLLAVGAASFCAAAAAAYAMARRR